MLYCSIAYSISDLFATLGQMLGVILKSSPYEFDLTWKYRPDITRNVCA